MKVETTKFEDVKVIIPDSYSDNRGCFEEIFSEYTWAKLDLPHTDFVQDNQSISHKGVLRGIHIQLPYSQGKLVRVSNGMVLDFIVDLRPNSDTFKETLTIELSAGNKKQLWIPKGFGHGFLSLEDNTIFNYKCTDFYYPEYQYTIKWDDPEINLELPNLDYIISEKDLAGLSLTEFIQKVYV